MSSSIEDSCSGKKIYIPTWDDCDTLDKKIGYIVGKIVNLTCSLVETGINNTIKILQFCHLDKITRCCLDILKKGKELLYAIIDKITEFTIPLFDFLLKNSLSVFFYEISKKFVVMLKAETSDLIHFVFVKILRQNISIPFFRKIIKPIYNYIFEPLVKKIADCFSFLNLRGNFKQRVSSSSSETLFSKIIKRGADFIDYLFIKILYQKILIPIFKPIGKKAWVLIKFLFNWTIKPLFNWVIFPCLETIYNIFFGITAGIFDKNNKEKPKKQTELDSP